MKYINLYRFLFFIFGGTVFAVLGYYFGANRHDEKTKTLERQIYTLRRKYEGK